MRRHGLSIAAGILLTVAGCGTDQADQLGDLEIPDLPVAQSETDTSASQTELSGTAVPEAKPNEDTGPTEADLRFALNVGDHFPLRKTIEQSLSQQTTSGPVTSKSRLSLMFAISVDAADEGRRRLTVRYQRVQYEHDILDEHIEYDSQQAPQFVPDALQVYHGLAGNGFSFWIGADNRIIDVLQFDDFLKRCVRHAPQERRAALLEQIVATQQDEGFANFVDDSIGLLPYKPAAEGRETAVAVDEQWQKSRRLMRPLPMEIRTTYTLSELTDSLAKVAIIGSIDPVKTAELSPVQQTSAQSQLELKSGYQSGTCIIDRETGLPLHSRVERHLKMQVSLDGEVPFEQYKTIVTTVESFPTHRTTFSASPIGPRIPASQVIRTEAQAPAAADLIEPIQNADFTGPVQ